MRPFLSSVITLALSAILLFGCDYKDNYGIYQVTPTDVSSKMTKDQVRAVALDLYAGKKPKVIKIEFGSISGPHIPKGTVGWAVSMSGLARTPVFVLIDDQSTVVLAISSVGQFPAPE